MRFCVRKYLGGFAPLSLLLTLSPLFAETEVDIRGLQSKSEGDMLQLIGGRLVYIEGKQASTWRANDAAYMVESILRNDGFYEATVKGRVESPDRIALIVNEGKRLSLGTVTMTGDGDAESLAETFSSPFGSSTPFGAGSPPFRADDVPTALDFVTRQLQAEGYWNVEVTLRKQNIDKETGDVDMTVNVDRGPDSRSVARRSTARTGAG